MPILKLCMCPVAAAICLFVLLCRANALAPLTPRSPATTTVPSIPDGAYTAMQDRIVHALDNVNGVAFIYNWFALLDENVTVCYPFVGVVDDSNCLFGMDSVRRSWGHGPFVNMTAVQQNAFWLSKQSGTTVGVFKYTTSSAYVHEATACVVQFEGVVMWQLSTANNSLISKWLEMPDSNRIAATYPC